MGQGSKILKILLRAAVVVVVSLLIIHHRAPTAAGAVPADGSFSVPVVLKGRSLPTMLGRKIGHLRIFALSDLDLAERLDKYKADMAVQVEEKAKKFELE